MTNAFDVPADELIEKVAEKLKSMPEIKAPEWASFVKTGRHKERPPVKKDWWYVRAASVLRSIYKLGPIGVSKLRRKYGGKKNRGVRPEIFYKGSGSIIRKILQQLELSELIVKKEVKRHKGRVATPKGKSLLDKTASELSKGMKKEVPKEVKKEKPKPSNESEKLPKEGLEKSKVFQKGLEKSKTSQKEESKGKKPVKNG